MSREVNCYFCKNKVKKSEALSIKHQYPSGNIVNRNFHEDCYDLHLKNVEEHKEMDKVCQYIKNEIFGWEEERRIPNHLVRRLQGLKSGSFAPKNGEKVYGVEKGFSYDVILKTIKFKKFEILQSMKNINKFKDDGHMINHLFVIIESAISTVAWKLKQKEESDRRLDNLSIDVGNHEFVNKTNIKNNKIANKLSHLW